MPARAAPPRPTPARRWTDSPLATRILLSSFALLSTWYVADKVILSNLAARIEFIGQIRAGQIYAPYQYRILKHALAIPLERLAGAMGADASAQHAFAYTTILLAGFLGVYFLWHAFLRTQFTPAACLLGAALLQAVVPLTITGFMMEGDVLTLLAYVAGLRLMVASHDAWIPPLVAVATLNREQMIYLVVFHALFLHAHDRLLRRRGLLLVALGAAAWAAVFLALRLHYGFRENPFVPTWTSEFNSDPSHLLRDIAPLWLAAVVPFAVLALLAWSRAPPFYRMAILSLVPYTVLFYFLGKMDELAKYLPAHLILLPPALHTLTGERMPHPMTRADPRPHAVNERDKAR